MGNNKTLLIPLKYSHQGNISPKIKEILIEIQEILIMGTQNFPNTSQMLLTIDDRNAFFIKEMILTIKSKKVANTS